MSAEKTVFNFFVEEELLQKIDVYRFDNRIPSRAEAVRQLLRYALEKKEECGEFRPD